MKKYPVSFLALMIALLFSGCGPSAKEREAAAAARAAAAKEAEAAAATAAKEQATEEAAAKPAVHRNPVNLKGVAAARIEGGYVTVLYENGRKGLFPVVDLTDEESTWINEFAAAHPLAHGKSTVVTAKIEVKKTIEKQVTENGIETVQLCAPAKLRDQIGGTCMFYARVHYLDIAGYPIQDGEIYKVINVVPANEPYRDYRYYVGMTMLFLRQKPSPVVHFRDEALDPFTWARQELRKGRPILAALPEDIWMSLPAEFLATHPFDGNSKIGHQVVINGFTYNPATQKGTFHVVNSWRALSEFDVPVEKKDEKRILLEQSLSPRGEPPEQAPKVIAGAITVLKQVGTQNLYAVETNFGQRKVVAASEDAAKAVVEADNSDKDLDTLFGEFVVKLYDYIQENAEPRIRDAAAAALMSELFRIPPTVALPHVDLEVKSSLGKVYFVRVGPEKVVKLYAESTGDALAKAKQMVKPAG